MGLFDKFKKKASMIQREQRQNENSNLTAAQPKPYICARCKKAITDEESDWIGNHRFCSDCAAPTKANTISHHLQEEAKDASYQAHMDSARGSLTPDQAYNRGFVKDQDGNWVYGKLVTNNVSCSAEQAQANTTEVPCDHTPSPQKKQAIQSLRDKIIVSIQKKPSLTYELSSLLWNDAAKCFPTTASFRWDGAWFKLNLETKQLYADVGTYPNQFGACREDRYRLSASEFYQKATAFHMSEELQCMETDADWQELFDEKLESAIANAQQMLNEQKEKQKQAERISNAVVIPDKFAAIKPTMEFDKIQLDLQQRYGSSSVCLSKESGKYILQYRHSATYSLDRTHSRRELSSAEAAWVEWRVNDCIHNPDKTTWQSLPGGDTMSVNICAQNKPNIERYKITPLKKYSELKNWLEKLAAYGSFLETDMKKIKKFSE